MAEKINYILKLAGWYPHRANPFNGDFVQRHAISIAQHQPVVVVFAVKDELVKQLTIEKKVLFNGRLTEYICYYPKRFFLDKLWSWWYYNTAFKKIFALIKKERGLPTLVHVNIAWKAGLWALWLKRKFRLPYVITENWTGYYEADPENLHTKPMAVQKMLRRIFQQSALFIPVTKNLGERCKQLFGISRYAVVENAVDTSLFFHEALPKGSKIRLVHVSTMNYQKNIEGLIRVMAQLAQQRNDFEWVLLGPASDAVQAQVLAHPALHACTAFTGNIPYVQVAAHVRQAHLMLLFSRYENLPCVILEALCCGVPVVATTVGGINEVIDESNGLLVKSEDETALLDAMNKAMDKLATYDRPAIAAAASAQYNYEAIGKAYLRCYKSM